MRSEWSVKVHIEEYSSGKGIYHWENEAGKTKMEMERRSRESFEKLGIRSWKREAHEEKKLRFLEAKRCGHLIPKDFGSFLRSAKKEISTQPG